MNMYLNLICRSKVCGVGLGSEVMELSSTTAKYSVPLITSQNYK